MENYSLNTESSLLPAHLRDSSHITEILFICSASSSLHSSFHGTYHASGQCHHEEYHTVMATARAAQRHHPGLWNPVLWKGEPPLPMGLQDSGWIIWTWWSSEGIMISIKEAGESWWGRPPGRLFQICLAIVPRVATLSVHLRREPKCLPAVSLVMNSSWSAETRTHHVLSTQILLSCHVFLTFLRAYEL